MGWPQPGRTPQTSDKSPDVRLQYPSAGRAFGGSGGCHAFEQKLREKTKGEVRLDHNQLSIVRRATRPCHWFWHAGASRQCGNLNLNKRMTARSLHRTNWMSRQEIYDTRLTHSRLSGECQLKTKPVRSVAGSPATAARPKGRTGTRVSVCAATSPAFTIVRFV